MEKIENKEEFSFLKFCEKLKKFLRFDYFEKIINHYEESKEFRLQGITFSSINFLVPLIYSKIKTFNKSIIYIIDDKETSLFVKMEMMFFVKILNLDIKKDEIFLFSEDEGENKNLLFEKLNENLIQNKPCIAVWHSNDLLDIGIDIKNLEKNKFELKIGEKLNILSLKEILLKNSFNFVDEVYEKNDFNMRGEILDLWPINYENPLRITFDDEIIESIYEFDITTQRRNLKKKYESIFIKNFSKNNNTIYLDNFDPKNFICFYDNKIIGNTKSYLLEKNFFSFLIEPFNKASKDIKLYESMAFNADIDLITKYLGDLLDDDYNIFIVFYKDADIANFKSTLFKNKKFRNSKNLHFFNGFIREGFYSLEEKIAFFTEKEIFNRNLKDEIIVKDKKINKKVDVFRENSIDYKIGDYVVHNNFGIGKFLGFSNIKVGEKNSEYITIEYSKGDKLFVPIFDFKFISKYSNYDSDYIPMLDSMDGFTWKKSRAKIEQKIFEMANSIISLQAIRKKISGFSFKENKVMEDDFRNTFPYEETEDQKKAIEEVLLDMASDTPMERLIAGDTGYGKTEVAIRAAFRAMINSKQVLLICPTTLLCKQHYNTFKERFSSYPFKISMLSRFLTKKDIEDAKKSILQGKIDLIISTHIALRSNIKFKDLGLVIIDEEHRFGVKDKEKLKMFQKNIDILYLSATPIPRTLSMALNGIKDISVIETPPPIRKNITTYIYEYDAKIIKQAIDFELSRGGQVFYLYNNVEDIEKKREELVSMFPDKNIATAHGQMMPNELDEKVTNFIDKKYDILVATTIIESGLDIPKVNMIIIDRADLLGLAQIYQLRGRVGRGYEKAFCYLLFPKDFSLNKNAIKRLEAIKSFEGFGAGIKLAMRDLEIRGAGNLLGKKQHGYIKEIGFELYMDMLKKAISKMNGEALEDIDCEIDLPISFYIPKTYIPSPPVRMYFYKELISITSDEEAKNIKKELLDRFGTIPKELENFFEVLNIKNLAKNLKISSIKENKNVITINFSDPKIIDINIILDMMEKEKGKIKFKNNSPNAIDLYVNKNKLDYIKNILTKLK